jgi:hypothetical protein
MYACHLVTHKYTPILVVTDGVKYKLICMYFSKKCKNMIQYCTKPLKHQAKFNSSNKYR